MSLRLVFRRAAQLEFDQAAWWYDGQRPGLGVEFVGEIQRILETIAEHPAQYPITDGDVRGAFVPRFPFCVYFRVKTNHVVIVAVFHTSREPSDWQGRS